MVIRRPLFCAFLILIVCILAWRYAGGEDEPEPCNGVSAECVGTVADIQVKPSGRTLILKDVTICRRENQKGTEEQKISGKKVIVYDASGGNLFSNSKIGNISKIAGTYSTFEHARNPGGFDSYEYYRSKNIQGRFFAEQFQVVDGRISLLGQGLFSLREQAFGQLLAVMQEEDAGVLGAMILGDKRALPSDTKELYQDTGIGHVLAISGLHISLLGAGLFYVLRRFVLPMRQAVLATIVFLFFYGGLTGFSVATCRAVIMMCCALLARYTGCTYDAVSAMSLSGIITLAQEPMQLFQSGFLLSYATICGMLLFQPALSRLKIHQPVVKSILTSVLFFVVTLPILLWFFYEFCPYTVLVNMVLLPLLSLLVGVGITGCCLCFISPEAGGFVLATAHYILRFYEFVCRFVQNLPGSRIVLGRPPFILIIMYYGVFLFMVWGIVHMQKREWHWFFGGMVSLFAVCSFFRPGIAFMYTQLDVGQGDCACIFHGDRTYMIDGGSTSDKEIGKRVIAPFLKFYGRSRVDCIWITHSDMDHTNGIEELAASRDGIDVPDIVFPKIREPDERYVKLVREFSKQGVRIRYMEKGGQFHEGAFSMLCLHPSADYAWQSENDYSLTLDIGYPGVRILATGDLEESGEAALTVPAGGYDILKVGHHGSKTSTSQSFLERVSPCAAVISAGKKNRYGHPSPETLNKLGHAHVPVWCTMETGAVFVTVADGKKQMASQIDKGHRNKYNE